MPRSKAKIAGQIEQSKRYCVDNSVDNSCISLLIIHLTPFVYGFIGLIMFFKIVLVKKRTDFLII